MTTEIVVKKKTGRPKGSGSLFTQEKADIICAAIAQGHTLREACSLEGMPKVSTVCLWVVEFPFFAEQYARARQAQAMLYADEIIALSDDDAKDDSSIQSCQRSRLRVDTRKWYLSKVLPKIYGDKIIHQGDEDKPLIVKHIMGDKEES